MKPLDKKNVSELLVDLKKIVEQWRTDGYDDRDWYQVIKDLWKQWAIAVVKNCNNIVETHHLPDEKVYDVGCGSKNPFRGGKVSYCVACQRFIDRFELTPKDLGEDLK